MADLAPPDVLDVLRRVEKRGALETAHRLHANIGQACRYAVATGRAQRDITADLRGALPPVQVEHMAAITDPKQVAELLRAIDGNAGTFPVACALKLAPLLFQRPGELRAAEWAEFDLEGGTWEISGGSDEANETGQSGWRCAHRPALISGRRHPARAALSHRLRAAPVPQRSHERPPHVGQHGQRRAA